MHIRDKPLASKASYHHICLKISCLTLHDPFKRRRRKDNLNHHLWLLRCHQEVNAKSAGHSVSHSVTHESTQWPVIQPDLALRIASSTKSFFGTHPPLPMYTESIRGGLRRPRVCRRIGSKLVQSKTCCLRPSLSACIYK